MLRLLTLRLSLEVWKRSLSISKSHRARTWIALFTLHVGLTAVSFWAYQADSVPESAIPAVYSADLKPVPLFISPGYSLHEFDWSSDNYGGGWSGAERLSLDIMILPKTGRPFPPRVTGYNWGNASVAGTQFSMRMNGSGFYRYGSLLSFQRDPFGLPAPRLPDYGRTTVVQVPPSEEPSLLTPIERMLALFSGSINTALSAFNLILLWQVYKRSKAEAILLQLQIEALKASNALLREEVEAARREVHKSGIILLS